MSVLTIAVGGALGAVARYQTYLWVKTHPFPFATLLVNVVGCFSIGLLMVFVEKAVPLHRHILLFGVTGFLGSYTTFSAFGFETLYLIRANQIGSASLNILANVLLGLGAVWLGRIVGLSR